MPQAGNVFIGHVKTPQEFDAEIADQQASRADQELRRLTVTAAVEKRNAEIAAMQQEKEQQAYLADAASRLRKQDGSPDFDAIINEAYGKNPQMAMGLEEHVTKQRAAQYDMRKKQLDAMKVEGELGLRDLEYIVDQRTLDIMRPRIAKNDPDLAQLLPETYEPQTFDALKHKGLTQKEQIDIELRKADDEFQRMQLAVQERQMAQDAADAKVNQDLRRGELGVAQGNLRVRQQEVNKPAGEGGAGGAKLSAGAVEKVAGVDQSLGMLDDIETLLPKFENKLGMIGGRVIRGQVVTGAGMTEDLAKFDAQITGLKNAVIKATTGAAMSEPEAKRIMGQIPDLTNPPAVFKARMATTRKNLEMLKKRTIELSGGSVAPSAPAATSKSDPLGIRKGGG